MTPDQAQAIAFQDEIKRVKALQQTERNFFPRCGKRLASGFVEISIHTCTPPRQRVTRSDRPICNLCSGSGEGQFDGMTCRGCLGSGEV